MTCSRAMRGLMVCGVMMASGCSSPLTVVPKAQRCDVDSALLASRCAQPQPLAAGATFEQMVSAMREDRQALLECRVAHDALRDALNRCNQQSDSLNNDIERINRANAAHN